jgi:hypothetical protein
LTALAKAEKEPMSDSKNLAGGRLVELAQRLLVVIRLAEKCQQLVLHIDQLTRAEWLVAAAKKVRCFQRMAMARIDSWHTRGCTEERNKAWHRCGRHEAKPPGERKTCLLKLTLKLTTGSIQSTCTKVNG